MLVFNKDSQVLGNHILAAGVLLVAFTLAPITHASQTIQEDLTQTSVESIKIPFDNNKDIFTRPLPGSFMLNYLEDIDNKKKAEARKAEEARKAAIAAEKERIRIAAQEAAEARERERQHQLALKREKARQRAAAEASKVQRVSYQRRSYPGNTYAPGNCTWYAKDRRSDLPNNLGNANTWARRAANQGIPTGYKPRPGAVGVSTAGEFGHVVIVESVNSDGTMNISEMNYRRLYSVSRRTISPSGWAFIY